LTTHRFYIKEKLRESSSVFLEGEEHHHLSHVARIRPGEKVWLFDDSGNQYMARVEEIQKKKTRLIIHETVQKRGQELRITLAQALLKPKNMDLVIQKATELDTQTIVPVISQRTVVKIKGKQENKMKRWKRIAIEASKQSGRYSVPSIQPPISLKLFTQGAEESKKLFLSERGGEALRDILRSPWIKRTNTPGSVILLVGPEGGWTEREEQDIMESHYEPVSLGSLTLRSETAAIVSLAMISHFWKNENVS
jgi:16S rRNA (uracil1498-N3)-methyltransferase